ncbi:MAG: tRNA (adenosine(37)-N6)-threonylcarbamoyltransferase complex dimerization subunit type 1 TsaB [Rhodothermales bacterium]
MASFLAIETATDVCSVAVLKGSQIAIEMVLTQPRAHSENLVPMIQDTLAHAGVASEELAGIVVSKGPGSYTGLRIGVSAAKGLAFAHQIDLIGVPSIEALATNATHYGSTGDLIAAAFNSRRNEVYLGLFETGAQASIKALGPIASLQQDEIAPFIASATSQTKEPHVIVVGEGGPFVADCLAPLGHIKVSLLPAHIVCPSASTIATLGAARHKIGLVDDLGSFEPFYLNEFIPKSRKKSIFDRLPF